MKGYVLGIQRGFSVKWGHSLKLLEGDIFSCPKEGLLAVLDNNFSLQQSNGVLRQSNNVLSKTDLCKLFTSSSLSRATPYSFQTRLIFGIAVVTAMRPTELYTLTMGQFKKTKLNGKHVWQTKSVIGSQQGASKTFNGGFRAAGDKPTTVCVWNRDLVDGNLNVYKDSDEYISARLNLETGTERFLQCNPKWTCINTFLSVNTWGSIRFQEL